MFEKLKVEYEKSLKDGAEVRWKKEVRCNPNLQAKFSVSKWAVECGHQASHVQPDNENCQVSFATCAWSALASALGVDKGGGSPIRQHNAPTAAMQLSSRMQIA